MLYHLFEYLRTTYDFPGVGLMQYLSVRAIIAIVTSILVSLIIGKKIIRFLQKKTNW